MATGSGAYLTQEPGGEEAKKDGVVGLAVVPGHPDVARVPELPLPALQGPGRGPHVEEYHEGAALDQPAPEICLWGPMGRLRALPVSGHSAYASPIHGHVSELAASAPPSCFCVCCSVLTRRLISLSAVRFSHHDLFLSPSHYFSRPLLSFQNCCPPPPAASFLSLEPHVLHVLSPCPRCLVSVCCHISLPSPS